MSKICFCGHDKTNHSNTLEFDDTDDREDRELTPCMNCDCCYFYEDW